MEKNKILNSHFRKNKLKNKQYSNRCIRERERHKIDKNLHFKTIDNPILIDQLIIDRNAKHPNQADRTPFTVEPLLSLVGKDTFTTFSQELLDETADLSQLKLSPTTQLYMQNLKQNNTIVKPPTNTTIPY